MGFNNSKYDVEINGVGYRLKGYQKSEVAPFIPRLGSGDQAESDFDLLRTKTIKGFAGGILQRYWQDDTSVFASEGMYPVFDDGVLYPVNAMASDAGVIGKDKVTAWTISGGYLFYAKISFNTPTTVLYRVDSAGTRTAMTIPASLSSRTVCSMTVWNGYLMITTTDGYSLWQMNIQSTTTVTEITAGAVNNHLLLAVFNGDLYYTNGDGNAHNSRIYKYTGTVSSKAGVEVARVPSYISSLPEANGGRSRLLVFNNRLILTRCDGLWAYDGIRLVAIEDQITREDTKNYAFATPLKGYLYYWMPDGMYRFSGSTIEKIYDISEIGTPVDVCLGKNRLWIAYANGEFSGSSRYDKSMGYNYSTGDNIDGRVAVFNGKALYTYGRVSTFVKNPGTIDFSGQSNIDRVMFFNEKVYLTQLYDKFASGAFSASTREETNTGDKTWRIVSSIYDGGFAMVDKNLENIELVFDGNVVSDQTITIEYRTGGFDGSTGWTTLGTILTQSKVKEYIWKALPTGVIYKKIQFRLSATSSALYGIAKFVHRYTLSPDFKWQWQFTILNYGGHGLEPLLLKDRTVDTLSVATLRNNIYSARSSDLPVKFIDGDALELNGTINSSVTSIVLTDTKLLKGDDGFIQIDDEIIYWSAKTSTTLTVLRGQLGTTSASHTTGAVVNIVYRVIIRQIVNERIEFRDDDIDPTIKDDRQSEISLILQEV